MVEPLEPPPSAAFVATWFDWWALRPPIGTLPTGIVCRADIIKLLPGPPPAEPDATTALLDVVEATLSDVVSMAPRWSPAPGLVDIHYAKLTREAAGLKHAVVLEMLTKRLRALQPIPAPSADTEAEGSRRIEPDRFRALCARAQARPDQVHELNVSEALFGRSQPEQEIGQRLWRRVEAVVDRSLGKTGYATRQEPHSLLLFFPGYSASMGEMKRHAIAQDIGQLAERLAGQAVAGSPGASVGGRRPKPAAAQQSPAERDDGAERERLTQALADTASKRSADLSDTSDLEFPQGYGVRANPIWLVKKRAVGGSMIEPVRKAEDQSAQPTSEGMGQFHNFDLPLLAGAAQHIGAQVAAGKSSLTIAPVHWDHLDQSRLRARYFGFCGKLPEAVRRLLVLELTGIPEDLMTLRVSERINQLRPLCRSVICRVRITRSDFSQFAKMPIFAVGISLDELPHYERGIIPAFDSFMDAAEAQKLRVYVHGLTSKSMLIATQAAGVDFVSGPIIPEGDAAPLGIRDFQISELYGAPAVDPEEPAP